MKNKLIFFDSEFSSLHQYTTLISIGLVSENGKKAYFEFNDYDQSQINDWLQKNVIQNCYWYNKHAIPKDVTYCYGNKEKIKRELTKWLSQFGPGITMVSDVCAFDFMLFNQLMADYSDGYPNLPCKISYVPFDIATVMYMKGVDPENTNREEFVGLELDENTKHNALHDAEVIRMSYYKLLDM